jgi:putative transcriptional regulator
MFERSMMGQPQIPPEPDQQLNSPLADSPSDLDRWPDSGTGFATTFHDKEGGFLSNSLGCFRMQTYYCGVAHMENVNLTNHFLIAMPNMADPNFSGSLTYICDHSEQGALGVVINRPTDLQLSALFDQIGLSLPGDMEQTVYFGGPVQTERGFVLHTPKGPYNSTLAVNNKVNLTTSKDVLEAVSHGEGPSKFMVSLGYAGWSAGQLENEMAQNAWLSVAADPDVIFDLPPEERLPAAMKLLGIDFSNLSDEAGHA